jgi:hypothetical protein
MAGANRRVRLFAMLAAGALLGIGRGAAAQPPPPPPPAPDTTPTGEPVPPPPPPTVNDIGIAPVIAPTPAPAPAPAAGAPRGLKIEGTKATAKLGFLLQPAFESAGSPSLNGMSNNFFLRRARLLAGMTLGTDLELFFETDSPNLGKTVVGAMGATSIVAPTANVQDAFMTWKPMDEFKIDLGMMLVPFSHNSLQGATTLYGWDYFAYSFQQSGGLGNYIGRDTGLQLRGLIAKHLEYRLGVFQGKRGGNGTPPKVVARNAPRLMARLQFNLFDAETGYFYAGTYGGTKKVVSIGGGIDHQDEYNAFAGDVFVDLPVGNDVFTLQANVIYYDGKTWINVPKQTDLVGEVGYRLGALSLSPIFRFEMTKISNNTAATGPDVMRIGGGLVYWYMGHNANLKAFYTWTKPDNDMLHSYSTINVQTQFFVF